MNGVINNANSLLKAHERALNILIQSKHTSSIYGPFLSLMTFSGPCWTKKKKSMFSKAGAKTDSINRKTRKWHWEQKTNWSALKAPTVSLIGHSFICHRSITMVSYISWFRQIWDTHNKSGTILRENVWCKGSEPSCTFWMLPCEYHSFFITDSQHRELQATDLHQRRATIVWALAEGF